MMKKRLDLHSVEIGKTELDCDGYRHLCRIDRITSSGAAVNCLGFLRETRPGDRVVLHTGAETGAIPCRVTAIAAGKIRLRFVD